MDEQTDRPQQRPGDGNSSSSIWHKLVTKIFYEKTGAISTEIGQNHFV
jgi:hypothetical protein